MGTDINNELLDYVLSQAKKNKRLRMNFNFHDALDAPAQRLLNALVVGTKIPIHRHNQTDETYFLLRGRIDILFYDISGKITKRYKLDPNNGNYGVNVHKGQWHTLDVLEDSVVFEVKDGPYKPFQPEDLLENHIKLE